MKRISLDFFSPCRLGSIKRKVSYLILTSFCFLTLSTQRLIAQLKFTSGKSITTVQKTDNPIYRFNFTLTSENEVENILINVSPFQSQDSINKKVYLSINGKYINGDHGMVKNQKQIIVGLTAELDQIGHYTSIITWTSKGDKGQHILEVERIRHKPPFEVYGLGTSENKNINFTLHDTSGRMNSIYPPRITELYFVDQNDSKMQVSWPTELTVEGIDSSDNSNWTIPAGGYKKFEIKIEKWITQIRPGKYIGTLSIGGEGFIESSKEFIVRIKHSFWLALVAISIGVGIYIFLETYFNRKRPNLVRRRKLYQLALHVKQTFKNLPNPKPKEIEVSRALKKQYEKLLLDLGNINESEFHESMDIYEKKVYFLSTWINLSDRINKLEPHRLQKDFFEDLKKFEDFLLDTKPTQNSEYLQKLKVDFDERITKKVKSELLNQIELLSRNFNKLLGDLPEYELKQRVDEIEKGLKKAKDEINSNYFENAQILIETIRSSYYIYAKNLLERKFLESRTPLGLEEEDWENLALEIKELFEEDEKGNVELSETIGKAYVIYYRNLIVGLKETVEGILNKKLKRFPSGIEEEREEIKEKCKSIINELSLALDFLKKGDYLKPSEIYRFQINQVSDVTKKIEKIGLEALGGNKEKLNEFKDISIANKSEKIEDLGNAIWEPIIDLDKIVDHDRQLKKLDLLVNSFLFVIANLLGLKFLWMDNPVWGEPKDYLIAILWGLGLNAFGGNTFKFGLLSGNFNSKD